MRAAPVEAPRLVQYWEQEDYVRRKCGEARCIDCGEWFSGALRGACQCPACERKAAPAGSLRAP